MIAERLRCRGFRNIEEADISFSPGVNVFLGNNAEGKTNALEAIYLMAAGKSFRTPREREMVKFGSPFFEVTLDMKDSRREQEIIFRAYSQEVAKRRECRKNGAPVTRLAELVGCFRAVLFCPEHLMLVKAGPAERRSFLDIALCQLSPSYLAALSRHNKVLSERNALLKQLQDGAGDISLLDVYSDQLSLSASQIFVARRAYIKQLDRCVKRFFEELSDGGPSETPALVYKNSLKTDEPIGEAEAYSLYLKALTSNTAREIAAGATLYGSHKDDIEISLDCREARLYASQGQQRSLALAMKLGEGEISMEYTGEHPVFLFDDVLSELDPTRQRFLLSRLGDRQVIMTACTPPPFARNVRYIYVEDGHYSDVPPVDMTIRKEPENENGIGGGAT